MISVGSSASPSVCGSQEEPGWGKWGAGTGCLRRRCLSRPCQCGLRLTWPDSLTQAFWGDARILSLLSPLRLRHRGWEERQWLPPTPCPPPPSQRPVSIGTRGCKRVPCGCSGACEGPPQGTSLLWRERQHRWWGLEAASASGVRPGPVWSALLRPKPSPWPRIARISLKMPPKPTWLTMKSPTGCGRPCWVPTRAAGADGRQTGECGVGPPGSHCLPPKAA